MHLALNFLPGMLGPEIQQGVCMVDLEALRLTLVERPRSLLLRDIAQATGLNENWLKAFAVGRITKRQSPKIDALARYFAEREA